MNTTETKERKNIRDTVIEYGMLPIVVFGPLYLFGCMISGAAGHPVSARFVAVTLAAYLAFALFIAGLSASKKEEGAVRFVFMTVFVSAYMSGLAFLVWVVFYSPIRWIVSGLGH